MTSIDPKAIDAEIAALLERQAKASRQILWSTGSLHTLVGDRREYRSSGRRTLMVWGLTDEQAEAKARAAEGVQSWDQGSLKIALAKLDAARAELTEIKSELSTLDQIYVEHRWSRFFMVQQGHIHSSMNCSTCNNGEKMTEFGWLPELSGETEAEAVAAHGALLCTVCFPSAPVEWTNHYEKLAAEKAAARCPGSGLGYDSSKPSELRRMSKWGHCRECGTVQTVTSTGKIRAHKKEA